MIHRLLWGVSDLSTPRDVCINGKYGVSHLRCGDSWRLYFDYMDVRVRGRTFEGGEVCRDQEMSIMIE